MIPIFWRLELIIKRLFHSCTIDSTNYCLCVRQPMVNRFSFMYSVGLCQSNRGMEIVLHLLVVSAPEVVEHLVCICWSTRRVTERSIDLRPVLAFFHHLRFARETHSCVRINGANGGFDSANSRWHLSPTDHLMLHVT